MRRARILALSYGVENCSALFVIRFTARNFLVGKIAKTVLSCITAVTVIEKLRLVAVGYKPASVLILRTQKIHRVHSGFGIRVLRR